ncbi:hypothetical protein CWO91_15400 [Bradyrhizobium genosp. SA-3]|nr:hypothetical protein CWO91_15400 [Bradyrhizobium genosp. SA-3]
MTLDLESFVRCIRVYTVAGTQLDTNDMFGPQAAIDEVIQFTRQATTSGACRGLESRLCRQARRLSAPLPLSESLVIAWRGPSA